MDEEQDLKSIIPLEHPGPCKGCGDPGEEFGMSIAKAGVTVFCKKCRKVVSFRQYDDAEKELNELDGLISTKGPSLDIRAVVEKVIMHRPAVQSLCMDMEEDRYALYELVDEAMQAAFKKWYGRLDDEHKWLIDNEPQDEFHACVLLGVMNTVGHWGEVGK